MGRAALPLLAITLTAVSYYTIRCAWWPMRKCRSCKGDGTRKRRGRTMLCRRCRGTGDSVRLGRVIVVHIRTRRAKAKAAA